MNSQPSALPAVSAPDGSGFRSELSAGPMLFCDRARDQLCSVGISFAAQAEKSIQFAVGGMPNSGGLNGFAGHGECSEKAGSLPGADIVPRNNCGLQSVGYALSAQSTETHGSVREADH